MKVIRLFVIIITKKIIIVMIMIMMITIGIRGVASSSNFCGPVP